MYQSRTYDTNLSPRLIALHLGWIIWPQHSPNLSLFTCQAHSPINSKLELNEKGPRKMTLQSPIDCKALLSVPFPLLKYYLFILERKIFFFFKLELTRCLSENLRKCPGDLGVQNDPLLLSTFCWWWWFRNHRQFLLLINFPTILILLSCRRLGSIHQSKADT